MAAILVIVSLFCMHGFKTSDKKDRNRLDSARSMHTMGVAVPVLFQSSESSPRGVASLRSVVTWLVVPRPRASHDTSASHRRPMRTYNSELYHNDEELRIPPV